MRRDGVLLSVWTLDCKIYVKTSPEGRPIKINDLEDLENVWRKHEIPKDDKLYGKWGRKPNRSMRMEHSQNFYGLFVVYVYVCVDVIIINFTTVVSIQTCLHFFICFGKVLK